MRVGEGNANFLFDLHGGVSDDEMRTRWRSGNYGKPNAKYITQWRKLQGRMK